MATRIRLARGGRKKRPFYRIVVADSRAPRDGRYIERIGSYDPLLAENKVSVDVERATHWLNVGAKPSHRVSKLLALQGVEHKLVVLPTPKAPAEGKPAAKGKAAEAKAESKAEDKPAQEAEAKAQEKPPQAAEAGDQPVAEAKAEPEEKPAGKAKAEPEEKPAQEAKDEGAADEKPARSAAKGKGKAAQAEGAADEAAEPAGEGEAESAS